MKRSLSIAFVCLGVLGACANPQSEPEGANREVAEAQTQREATPKTPAAPVIPGPLGAAHQAYLAGDFVGVGERVRDVLVDPASSDLVKANAYALLDKSYAVKHGAIPANFKAPPGVQRLQYLVRRFTGKNGPAYQVRFAGTIADASHLSGLTVRREGEAPMMDKVTGKGKYEVRHDASARSRGVEEFVIDSDVLSAPPEDGVVSLRIALDDGTIAEGFIIAHGLSPVNEPDIQAPTPSQTLNDENPTVKWTVPRARESIPFERTRSTIHVGRVGDDVSLWEFSGGKVGEVNEVAIGSAAGSSTMALTPGNYWMSVSATDARTFGPVELLRATRLSRAFQVTR